MCELFGALLFYCPCSTTWQCPSIDLRHLEPEEADLNKYGDSNKKLPPVGAATSKSGLGTSVGKDSSPEDDHSDEQIGHDLPMELPPVELMVSWRELLRRSAEAQGVRLGEIEIEILHGFGWRGGDIYVFTNELEKHARPHAVCRGLDVPFTLPFSAMTSSMRIHSSSNIFVVGWTQDPLRLLIRPATYVNNQRLVRPPDWPRMFEGTRIPTEADFRLVVDSRSTPSVQAAHEEALLSGRPVPLRMVLTPLPSGSLGLAVPGERPHVVVQTGLQSFDATGTLQAATFYTPHLLPEAVELLHGRDPGNQRVRDLSVFSRVPSLSIQVPGWGRPNMAATLVENNATQRVRAQVDELLNADESDEAEISDVIAQLGRVSTRSDSIRRSAADRQDLEQESFGLAST